MEKITTDKGEVIDAYSKEEVDAGAKEAAETATKVAEDILAKYKEENPDKTEDIEKLETELKESKDKLDKLEGKESNFAKLREQKEGAEAKIEDLQKTMEEQIKESAEATKKEVLEGVYKDHYQEELTSLAGQDDELKKLIEVQYERLTDPTTNKGEISKKLRDAWTLATKQEDPNALNTAVISSGGAAAVQTKTQDKLSPEVEQVASKFGLSQEDFNKFDNPEKFITKEK